MDKRNDEQMHGFFLISSVVEPRTKKLQFLSHEQRIKAWELVVGECVKIATDTAKMNLPSLPDITSTPESDRSQASQPHWLDDVIYVATEKPNLSLPECIQMEVDKYVAEDQITHQDNSLAWWRSHQVFYPTIAQLARTVLYVPASSVPSERIFSLAGNIITNTTQSR